MEDINKTKEILLSELIVFRQRLAELEAGKQKPQALEHILRERIKELQCIYAITQIVDIQDITLDEICRQTVLLLPSSWQYPEVACARITMGDKAFKTENYIETTWKLSENIEVNRANVGIIEVNYLEERPESDEGPFLKEERILINVIAERLARIIEQKQIDEVLRRSEEQYRLLSEKYETLIKNIPVTIYSCLPDETATMIYISDRWKDWTGYSPEDFYKNRQTWPKSVHPEDLVSATKAYIGAYSKKKEYVFEYRVVHKDTRQISYVIDHGVPIKDEKGNVIRFDGIMTNITERKQLEREKRELEQKAQVTSRLTSLGKLASGIAHEINNPLTAIISCSHLLTQEDLPEATRKSLRTIHRSAKRVADIVNRLLVFSRQEKPERKRVNINELIETILALRAYEMKTGNIKVTTQLTPDLPWTTVDPGQLQQVFLNIILNAEAEMKLAYGKGRLLIKTEALNDTIRILFEDNGPGIAKENLEKIFDPFFTTREIGQGTGLGLSLCHAIVAAHNGRIYARSRLGNGATFVVELPIVAEEKQPE